MTCRERATAVGRGILATSHGVTHIMIGRTRTRCVTVRAVRMMVMPVVAVIPVGVHRAAVPTVPPVRVIPPVPRRSPTSPVRIPEPVVDIRTVNIHRLDDVVGAIDIFVTYHLGGYLPCRLVLLHIDGCDILEYVLCQHGLDNHQVLIVSRGLDYSQVINYSVTIEVKIGESGVGVVEECFELLHVLDCSEQVSHRFQVERLAYVL